MIIYRISAGLFRLIVISEKEKNMISNPILKGFHLDPSIIRVGEDYYIAKLSFPELFLLYF